LESRPGSAGERLALAFPRTMTDDLKRGSKLGKHELLVRIGRGGMATVWVAVERGPSRDQDRIIAVKAILTDLAGDPEFVKMFLDEGRIVRLIRHPNVVDVYEVGEAEGIVYMSMEWVEGDTLHAVIAEAGKRRPIPPEMAVRIIADAAGGLHAAHEVKDETGNLLGVVHRDVSPHNILIGRDGSAKLVDFGVARAMGRMSDATSAGQLKGKFGYMSPEQAMAKKVDRRSDIFSLGTVLFELTTGRRLFRGEHDAETLHLVVGGKIPKPTALEADYPPALEAIVLKALERDPNRRFQTAEELREALLGYLKSERIVVPQSGVANLLKKVMGARMEQRRKAVRAALAMLEGGAADAAQALVPSDPHAASEPQSSVSGVAGAPHSVTPAPHSPSDPGDLSRRVSGSFTGSHPSPTLATGSQTVPAVAVKKSGVAGYVIGVLGLAAALVAVLLFVFNPRRTQTTIVTVPTEQAAEQQPAAPSPASPSEATADDPSVPVVGLDELGGGADAGRRPVSGGPRAGTAKVGAAPPAAAKKPAEAPKQSAPPRQNPYE
jgi:eukaryotic-like serine/threonine-protein kinase